MTLLNKDYSFKSFNERWFGAITFVNGTTVDIGLKGDFNHVGLKINDVQYAILEFTSGGLQGNKYQIISNGKHSLTVSTWLPGIPQKKDKFKIYWKCDRIPLSEFNDCIIRGSDFSQEFLEGESIPLSGGKSIFPSDVTGLVLRGCNVDNVYIPPGVTVEDDTERAAPSTNKTIKVQNDCENWMLEKVGDVWQPKEPIGKLLFEKWGVSVNPNDIPAEKMDENILDRRIRKIKELLDNTQAGIVLSGGLVIEDNDDTNDLDTRLTPGTVIGKNLQKYNIISRYSKDVPMIRHWINNDVWYLDTNTEIDTTKYCNGQGLVPVNVSKYYKSLFFVDKNNKINWVYPMAGYDTIQEAKDAIDPLVPDNIGLYVKSSVVVIEGNATAFPALASGQWVDRRPLITNIQI
jgi:hypothetical protein